MGKLATIVKIQCPKCGFVYEVAEVLHSMVSCQEKDCSAQYLQAAHNMDRPESIRKALFGCRGQR